MIDHLFILLCAVLVGVIVGQIVMVWGWVAAGVVVAMAAILLVYAARGAR